MHEKETWLFQPCLNYKCEEFDHGNYFLPVIRMKVNMKAKLY